MVSEHSRAVVELATRVSQILDRLTITGAQAPLIMEAQQTLIKLAQFVSEPEPKREPISRPKPRVQEKSFAKAN